MAKLLLSKLPKNEIITNLVCEIKLQTYRISVKEHLNQLMLFQFFLESTHLFSQRIIRYILQWHIALRYILTS